MKARGKVDPKPVKRSGILALSPSTDGGEIRNPARQMRTSTVREEDIPWAEIIFESDPVLRKGIPNQSFGEAEIILTNQSPPFALFAIAALGLLILLYFST